MINAVDLLTANDPDDWLCGRAGFTKSLIAQSSIKVATGGTEGSHYCCDQEFNTLVKAETGAILSQEVRSLLSCTCTFSLYAMNPLRRTNGTIPLVGLRGSVSHCTLPFCLVLGGAHFTRKVSRISLAHSEPPSRFERQRNRRKRKISSARQFNLSLIPAQLASNTVAMATTFDNNSYDLIWETIRMLSPNHMICFFFRSGREEEWEMQKL